MLIRAIGFFVANGIGLYLADYFITGVDVSTDPKQFLIATAVLAAINMFIRPIIKVVLTPFIILTLGLLTLVINGFMLYTLDALLSTVTITGLLPLLYATILTTVINVLVRSIIR